MATRTFGTESKRLCIASYVDGQLRFWEPAIHTVLNRKSSFLPARLESQQRRSSSAGLPCSRNRRFQILLRLKGWAAAKNAN